MAVPDNRTEYLESIPLFPHAVTVLGNFRPLSAGIPLRVSSGTRVPEVMTHALYPERTFRSFFYQG